MAAAAAVVPFMRSVQCMFLLVLLQVLMWRMPGKISPQGASCAFQPRGSLCWQRGVLVALLPMRRCLLAARPGCLLGNRVAFLMFVFWGLLTCLSGVWGRHAGVANAIEEAIVVAESLPEQLPARGPATSSPPTAPHAHSEAEARTSPGQQRRLQR